jgi:hypothetical protein
MTGCQNKPQDKETAFLKLHKGIDFNQDIILVEDPYAPNVGIIGSEIDLKLLNQSSKLVSYDLSKDVKIFTYTDNKKWIQLKNIGTYRSVEEKLLPGGVVSITSGLVFVYPEIEDQSKPIIIRVVAIGHSITDDEETKDVGAYFDSRLIPVK